MNKLVGALLLSLTLAVALAPSVPFAAAAKPQQGGGSFSGGASVTSSRMAGPNGVAQMTYQMSDTGALSGNCTGTANVVAHVVGMFATIHGTCSFSGSVQVGGSTLTGTAHVTIEAKGFALGGLSGRFVLIGDSGTGLAGVQAEGPASGTWTLSGTFSGTFSMQAH